MTKLFANSGDPDQMPRSAASDLGLHCLPITLLWVSRLQWVKTHQQLVKWTCLYLTFTCWVILHAFLSSVDIFFLNPLFQKNLSGIPSECQTVWIQIWPDVLSGLIWVRTVYKAYQQMTKVATS